MHEKSLQTLLQDQRLSEPCSKTSAPRKKQLAGVAIIARAHHLWGTALKYQLSVAFTPFLVSVIFLVLRAHFPCSLAIADVSGEQSESDTHPTSPSSSTDAPEFDLYLDEDLSDDTFGFEGNNCLDGSHDYFAGAPYGSVYSSPSAPDGPTLYPSHSDLQLIPTDSTYFSQALPDAPGDDRHWPWWNLTDYDPSIPLHRPRDASW